MYTMYVYTLVKKKKKTKRHIFIVKCVYIELFTRFNQHCSHRSDIRASKENINICMGKRFNLGIQFNFFFPSAQ